MPDKESEWAKSAGELMSAPYSIPTLATLQTEAEAEQRKAFTVDEPKASGLKIFGPDKIFEPLPPLEYLVGDDNNGLIPKNTLTLLMGPSGHKKTYVANDLGVCVSTGAVWLGFPTHQTSVLIVDEEMGERNVIRRVRETMNGHLVKREDAAPITCMSMQGVSLRPNGEDVPEGIAKLRQAIQETGAELIIIDSFVAITAGLDENSVKDMQPVMMHLRRLVDTLGVTIICIHHANKTTGKYRGSTAIEGALDLLLSVDSPQGSKYVTFNTEKARYIEPKHFTALATWQRETEQFYLSPTDVNPKAHVSRLEACVLRFISEHPNTTTNDIIDACETSRNYVQTLARDGKIERTNKGVSGKIQAEYAITRKGADILKSTGDE
jgi:archaellum biogenesis ATPase FlaH